MLTGLGLLLSGTVLAGKEKRTYYDAETMANLKAKISRHAWAKQQVKAARKSAAWYLSKSDLELWEFVPPPEQLRAINVCIAHDCPFCGDEITRKAGHYPWLMDRAKPFKLECPVCERQFPENDFEPWNTAGLEGKPETGERIIDRGLGWVGPDDRRYYFVPYYIFWQRWVRDIIGGMKTLSRAYLLTDDPAYARKCAVMMAKVASQYERFDYRVQCYHEGRFNVNGRISDRIWSTGDNMKIALAYDAIHPVFDDPKLLAFLDSQGIASPRQLIEKRMLNVMADDIMRGYVAGNMGMHQKALACLAIVLDNDVPEAGPTTAQMRDWIMTGPGRVEDLLWNGFWRDGLGSESAPGYASSWCGNFYQLAELLPKLGVDIWANPKLKRMADIGIDMTVAGKFCPDIGDFGRSTGSRPVAMSASLQGPALTHYGEPRHAKALKRMNAKSRNLFQDYFDEAVVERAVAEHGTDMGWKTRSIGGYGLAVLESGAEEHRRAITMYYGYAGGGHGHYDRLNIQMWAFGKAMLPEDGYPFPFTKPNFWRWQTTGTVKHYCVVVDETAQMTLSAGHLNTLASAPFVQLMDASAEAAYPGLVSLYRRTTALIDIDDERAYALDIFRVQGGAKHDWCFHGPAFFDLAVNGGTFGPVQTRGTLAGADTPYGKRPTPRVKDGVYLDLQAAEGLLDGGPHNELSRRGWTRNNAHHYHGDAILTRKEGSMIRMTCPRPLPPGRYRVFLHVYDANAGANEIVVRVGDTEARLIQEPSGRRGYVWVSGEAVLADTATEVTLTAERIGQKLIQAFEVVIARDTGLAAPPFLTGLRSGYHGLYNVRRMKPEGSWSAKWHKADEDLSLTMTMPAGDAHEVIVADASPEQQPASGNPDPRRGSVKDASQKLKPGNPDTIQYVLARRASDKGVSRPDDSLRSAYIATIEPHRGASNVRSVEHLQAPDVAPETVGVVVRREGGVIDLVHSSLSSTAVCRWRGANEPFVVAAEFALVTIGEAGVERAVMVNGTLLRFGDFSLEAEPSPTGTVASVDFARNSITVDRKIADPEALRGSVIILGNDLHQTNYTIVTAEATGGGTRLYFGDILYIVGKDAVAGVDTGSGTVKTARALSGYGKIDGGRHQGRWLYNEDKSKGFLIEGVENRAFKLATTGDELNTAFPDIDGDGRRVYWISDIGPGDTFRIPTTTTYARRD
ncbi:MAG: heparinase II/III family protein [Lentisphaeria bacterium]|nr:heparinase II/III family protein [Lentisphaeria bacterium]